MNLFKKLLKDEAGQDLAEYGIALAVIAAGLGAIALAISNNVLGLWSRASGEIATAAGS